MGASTLGMGLWLGFSVDMTAKRHVRVKARLEKGARKPASRTSICRSDNPRSKGSDSGHVLSLSVKAWDSTPSHECRNCRNLPFFWEELAGSWSQTRLGWLELGE